MSRSITAAGLQRAADKLGVSVAHVRAVIAVEAGGAGFLADGRPKILFERHKFSLFSGRKFDASHGDISSRTAGGYRGGEGEYLRLYKALQLDGEAAVRATSWGAFQIMGFNWEACGERSLYGFLMAVHDNEDAHLALFVNFVLSEGLAPALQKRDWAAFARGYNGVDFARNQYDKKLAAAYAAAGGV
ncbi:N-acetylmuramidase family protein [Luteimonas notoginsengisoli]|uniref:N-acetylmuramidase family protein n=1 Tax=Luteimonas notoginsengisoli TaxID=1578200 RepID=A0ABV7UR75_9GAMM